MAGEALLRVLASVWEELEHPLAGLDPLPTRRWTSRDILSVRIVDTACNGLLSANGRGP